MPALHALLDHAIDFAGFFPPAEMPMRSAVEVYARHRSQQDSWALGRLVMTVEDLAEFREAIEFVVPGPDEEPWPLAAVVKGHRLREDLDAALALMADPIPGIRLEVIEVNDSGNLTAIQQVSRIVNRKIPTFMEIDLAVDPIILLSELRTQGLRAKARLGGLHPRQIPPAREVARFLVRCSEYQIDYKFTAGLHHPIRSVHPLSYSYDAPKGMMHGFLNILLASAFVQFGMGEALATQVIEETNLDAFSFNGASVAWNDYKLSADQLTRARKMAMSFGSCSFDEPFRDLRAAGLIK
jgi:hypothetical protein